MKQLTIEGAIKVNLDTLDDTPDVYNMDEVVDLLKIQIQDQFYQYDMEIDVFDYRVDDEEYDL